MPTVIRIFNLIFMIHTNDHEPAHVTVYLGNPKNYDAKARIEIATASLIDSTGFSTKDLRIICEIVEDRKMFLQEAWNETRPKD